MSTTPDPSMPVVAYSDVHGVLRHWPAKIVWAEHDNEDRDDPLIRQRDAEAALAALQASLNNALALAERFKLEAQCHAQEARTQRATVRECYQIATGSTGEPGDWNGANPVRALRERLDGAEKLLQEALEITETYPQGSAHGKLWSAIAAHLAASKGAASTNYQGELK